jgi:hypothetical protein
MLEMEYLENNQIPLRDKNPVSVFNSTSALHVELTATTLMPAILGSHFIDD